MWRTISPIKTIMSGYLRWLRCKIISQLKNNTQSEGWKRVSFMCSNLLYVMRLLLMDMPCHIVITVHTTPAGLSTTGAITVVNYRHIWLWLGRSCMCQGSVYSVTMDNMSVSRTFCMAYFIHWGQLTHICVSKLGNYWFKWWLFAWPEPSHYLNKCQNIVNMNIVNNCQRSDLTLMEVS